MRYFSSLYGQFRDRLVGQVENPERERHYARLGRTAGGLCVAASVVANTFGDYNPQSVALGGTSTLWVALETVFIDGIDAQAKDGQQGQIGI